MPFDGARISEELFRHADPAKTYPIGVACAVGADCSISLGDSVDPMDPQPSTPDPRCRPPIRVDGQPHIEGLDHGLRKSRDGWEALMR